MELRQDEVLLRPWQVADEETAAAINALSAQQDVVSFAIVDLNCDQLVGNIAAVNVAPQLGTVKNQRFAGMR